MLFAKGFGYAQMRRLWQIGLNFGKRSTRPSQVTSMAFRIGNCAITKTISWKCRLTMTLRFLPLGKGIVGALLPIEKVKRLSFATPHKLPN